MKRILSFAAILLLLTVSGCGNKQKEAAAPEAPAAAAEETTDMSQYVPGLENGNDAPDFEAPDVTGNMVKLSDFRGKYVVLDFWASWCKDCRAEMPAVKDLYGKYASDDVVFLGVSFDTDLQAMIDYSVEAEIPWMCVCNQIKMKENPISVAYGLHWIPTMFLINPEGKSVGYAFTADELEKLLAAEIAG